MKPIPVNLKKLSDVLDNDVVKMTRYNELVKKVNAINTNELVKKTDYNAKINEIEGKIPSVGDVLKKLKKIKINQF